MESDVQIDVDLSELPLLLKRANLENAPQALASLVFDSFAQPALAGARGGAAMSRQIVLRAEGFDIHLVGTLNEAAA